MRNILDFKFYFFSEIIYLDKLVVIHICMRSFNFREVEC